jgi:hypothetical protein
MLFHGASPILKTGKTSWVKPIIGKKFFGLTGNNLLRLV